MLVLIFTTWLTQGSWLPGWLFFQIATNYGSPHLQIRHNLSGLYLADWEWLHPIAITFNTLYALWNFTSSGAGLFSELAGAHT